MLADKISPSFLANDSQAPGHEGRKSTNLMSDLIVDNFDAEGTRSSVAGDNVLLSYIFTFRSR